MKKGIHPEYREVLFHDISVDEYFLIGSTLKTDKTKEWEDGKTYPYYPLDVSSASHPFYTGKQKILDTGGRVQKFEKRFGKKS
jgi:large subunit ribosomal protein L31|tara:strand:- start:30 stop:278 length:249 start_codon:yes stop_codon:yes gene_type:complete